MKLNHVLVNAKDMQSMSTFLTDVIGLEKGYRPPFPFPGMWFYSEGKALIHLVESEQDRFPGAVDHVALEGADYQKLMNTLKKNEIPYSKAYVPLCKQFQIFVEGPDHLKFEFLFDADSVKN